MKMKRFKWYTGLKRETNNTEAIKDQRDSITLI